MATTDNIEAAASGFRKLTLGMFYDHCIQEEGRCPDCSWRSPCLHMFGELDVTDIAKEAGQDWSTIAHIPLEDLAAACCPKHCKEHHCALCGSLGAVCEAMSECDRENGTDPEDEDGVWEEAFEPYRWPEMDGWGE